MQSLSPEPAEALTPAQRLDRILTAVAVMVIAVFGFLPIANWIPGGPSIPPWSDLAAGWWSGAALVAGAAIVFAILSRRVPIIVSSEPARGLVEGWTRRPGIWTAGLMLAAFAAYTWAALSIFSGRPLLIDEIAQVYQARIFADGLLTRPAGPHPEFFTTALVLARDGTTFAQFPAGGPAMLAMGSLLGAEWLTGPLFGAVSVGLFASLVRRIEPRPGVALAASVLFAFAPLAVFMSGTHMNHVTTLTWILVGCTGLARLTGPEPAHVRSGLLTGLGFGIAVTIRPTDGFAFAAPAALWLLARTIRRGGWLPLVAAGVALAAPAAVQLWINARVTGSPWLFAYVAQWGGTEGLGFHATPWGDLHTPARGLELLNLYFVRLQSYFLELPIPSLLPAGVALALTGRLSTFDRYLLAAAALLAGVYFAYWHDGFYLGPRFLFPLLPLLALWTARALPAVRDRVTARRGAELVGRALGFAALIAVILALGTSLPQRAQEYRSLLRTMRWDANRAAREAGVAGAVVLVRESWGSQLIARMWAAGVSRSDAERIYRAVDACGLERALDSVESLGLKGEAAAARIRPLLRDSARVVASPFTPDRSTRLLPGSAYTAECLERLREDRRGFTLFTPLLLAGGDDVLYARDLHARDSLLLRELPDRAVYLLRPPSAEEGAAPRFELLRRDSLLAAWRAAR